MFGFHHHRHAHRGRHAMARGRDRFEEGFGDEASFGRGRGGRRRMFDGEELRLVLLALLEAQPRHGYDLIREVEERTGGAYVPSPGVVYPTLTMLDDLGQIEDVKEEGARRRFAITDAGRAALDERRAVADALLARLAQLGQHSARGERAAVRRAMVSLHMALRTAISARDEQDRANDIAAILDEATRKIEAIGD